MSTRHTPTPYYHLPVPHGARLGVFAPAGVADLREVEAGMERLRSAGFHPEHGETLWQKRGYLAGTDEQRAAELMRLVRDPQIRGLIAAKGGYGCTRMLPYLDLEEIGSSRKFLLGYSDVTALLLAVSVQTGLVTWHGPTVMRGFTREGGEFALRDALHCAQHPETPRQFALRQLGVQVLAEGSASGPLWGGCLTLLAGLCGTPYLPSFAGSIFFFEDVGEEPYRLDRMLMQMRLATDLDRCAGVVVGHLHNCVAEHPERSLTIDELLLDHFGSRAIPIIREFPIGHGIAQWTLPLGRECQLDTVAGVFSA